MYTSARDKVQVLCRYHGPFQLLPGNHTKGSGCPVCGQTKARRTQTHSTEKFIEQSRAVHGDLYSYEKTMYVKAKEKVEIVCGDHGSFFVVPYAHKAGNGCPQCGYVKQTQSRSLTHEEFLDKAHQTHGEGTYGYSNVQYLNGGTKVSITCSKHGSFEQTPENHLYLGAGCPSCFNKYTKPHKEVESYLDTLGVEYRSNDRTLIAPLEIDILIPQNALAIEFNGTYWHSLTGNEPSSAKNKHADKFYACEKLGILLLQIDEHEWKSLATRAVWESVISSKLGKHKRILARNTAFHAISRQDADDFLSVNHLQGKTPAARWCFGLFHDAELVGVITFAEHEKEYLNLSRMAFKLHTTVVGGAQKLFKNAVKLLPERPIITFSNNRYSNGAVYSHLGFTREATLPVSYQWHYKNRVWNKRLLRRCHLPKVLGEAFDPLKTEHENMYQNGGRCLYDAGYQRWAVL